MRKEHKKIHIRHLNRFFYSSNSFRVIFAVNVKIEPKSCNKNCNPSQNILRLGYKFAKLASL